VDEELVLGFQLSWKAEMIEYSLAQQIREYVKIEEQKALEVKRELLLELLFSRKGWRRNSTAE